MYIPNNPISVARSVPRLSPRGDDNNPSSLSLKLLLVKLAPPDQISPRSNFVLVMEDTPSSSDIWLPSPLFGRRANAAVSASHIVLPGAAAIGLHAPAPHANWLVRCDAVAL